ncbi:MAG: cyclopropane-fatty-acyl-phospholipid synthase family protein [Nitrospirota bacterium]|nr:cyclopropane-fatty-acyl-phospholipid synthase family protein [Nitrospirota bacterium]
MNDLVSAECSSSLDYSPCNGATHDVQPGSLVTIARRLVFARLRRITSGTLTIIEGERRTVFGDPSSPSPLRSTIIIQDSGCYLDIAWSGSIGAGESYARGWWQCEDLTALIRLFVLNRHLVDGMERGLARLSAPLLKAAHRLRRNTTRGSRQNIAAHYDLSNEFFSLMLDQSMMYSCAYFQRPDSTLEEASRSKIDLICRKLHLSKEDHLVEIGSGWGGLACHAAETYGCHVTTTTISRAQYETAVRRVREAGLSDRVRVLLTDYRDLPALGTQFDKLVSVEMIEAVGHEYYTTFFDVCSRLLKPDGLMLMQAITIDERYYERAKRSVDFIQRFIFPGSCIPSVSTLCVAMTKASDFSLLHLQDIGAHYPPTLRSWRENIRRNLAHVRQLGIGPEFLRLWEFYLSYCEGGFLERSISTAHLLFAKSGWRQDPLAG